MHHTYDPHAIEGHLGVELRYHVLPPVKGLRVGEIGEGGRSRPDLNKSPEGRANTTQILRQSPVRPQAQSGAAASL